MSSASNLALLVGAALAVAIALFAHGVGYDRDRAFYPVVLTVVGALYVLFAVIADAGPALMIEVAFFALFAGLAVVGFRWSLWLAVFGLALHGAFDFVRHSLLQAPGAPNWWPAFCGSYDMVAALGLAVIMTTEGGAMRASPSNSEGR